MAAACTGANGARARPSITTASPARPPGSARGCGSFRCCRSNGCCDAPVMQARPREPSGILVGTSSWTDKTLIESGKFYPPTATTPEDRLRFYASQFPIVEIDSSYYGI